MRQTPHSPLVDVDERHVAHPDAVGEVQFAQAQTARTVHDVAHAGVGDSARLSGIQYLMYKMYL